MKLVEAAYKGNLAKVKELIESKSTTICVREETEIRRDSTTLTLLVTPLLAAAYGGHKAIVEHLLANGAKLYEKDDTDTTVLGAAAVSGNLEAFEFILQKTIESRPHEIEIDRFLQQIVNKYGNNLLHLATIGGNIQIIKILIQRHAFSLTAINSSSFTPFLIAVSLSVPEVIFYFITEHQQSPNEFCVNLATHKRQWSVLRACFLLDASPNKNIDEKESPYSFSKIRICREQIQAAIASISIPEDAKSHLQNALREDFLFALDYVQMLIKRKKIPNENFMRLFLQCAALESDESTFKQLLLFVHKNQADRKPQEGWMDYNLSVVLRTLATERPVTDLIRTKIRLFYTTLVIDPTLKMNGHNIDTLLRSNVEARGIEVDAFTELADREILNFLNCYGEFYKVCDQFRNQPAAEEKGGLGETDDEAQNIKLKNILHNILKKDPKLVLIDFRDNASLVYAEEGWFKALREFIDNEPFNVSVKFNLSKLFANPSINAVFANTAEKEKFWNQLQYLIALQGSPAKETAATSSDKPKAAPQQAPSSVAPLAATFSSSSTSSSSTSSLQNPAIGLPKTAPSFIRT